MTETILYALTGGLVPVIIWLLFWLKEDRAHPEPLRRVALVFLAGALAVVVAYLLERLWCQSSWFATACQQISNYSLGDPANSIGGREKVVFVIWATTEEILKLFAAYLVVFNHPDFDEPVDAMVYLITAALGFAALENAFFLFDILTQHPASAGLTFLLTGNLRFLGANITHIVSSAVVGAMVGLSFCLSLGRRLLYTIIGLTTAILLHSLFNLLIITSDGGQIFKVFSLLWLFAILIILLFERVKRVVCATKV